jgi:hypothetical protein
VSTTSSVAALLKCSFSPAVKSIKEHTPGRLDVVEDKVILTGFANAGDKVRPFDRELPLEPKWTTNGS